MRALACALAALSFAAAIPGSAAAQSYGPSGDSYQSGPPPYFTERAPARNPDQGFDRPPPQRREQSSPWPPAGQNTGPRPLPDQRAREARPRPPSDFSNERPQGPAYRRAEPSQGPGPRPEMSSRPPDNRGERRVIVSPNAPGPRGPAPRERYGDNGTSGSASRVMIGPNEIVISIAEYEELKGQAQELARLRGPQGDDRDYRPGSAPAYR